MTLQEKYDLYRHLIKSHQDKHGFIHSDECDSLLFSSLIGCVPGVDVNIDAARDFEGAWHRRPTDLPECCPDHSKSTISRDMLLGLAWYAWENKQLDISENVIKYALKHFMVMGKGNGSLEGLSRIIMSPGLLSTFAWISYRLGGPSRYWLRWMPAYVTVPEQGGFRAHLAVLHCMLRDQLIKKENPTHKEIYAFHARRQPSNPLFAWANGSKLRAITILSDERLWPENRQPARSDRKSPWLFERDYGPNWKPAPGNDLWTGGDFLFLFYLINK